MRKLLFLTSILIAFVSCKEEKAGCLDPTAVNYNASADVDDESCEYYELGTEDFGGIIFYLDETGKHGLVVAKQDLVEGSNMGEGGTSEGYEWGCMETEVVGAAFEEIGSGLGNSQAIVDAECISENGGITAAEAVLEHEVEFEVEGEIVVYDDWYLPSKSELEVLFNTLGPGSELSEIGAFEEDHFAHYWSSTETSNSFAWLVSYSHGTVFTTGKKNLSFRVRPIRSF